MSVKMKMKMKNRSHRLDRNRPTFRDGHKYSKYRKCVCCDSSGPKDIF